MSSYSEGQVHQLVDRLEAEGFTPTDLTKLGQFANLGGVRAVVNGRAEIVALKLRFLELVRTVKVGSAKRFAASDNFVIGTAGIGWLGENFNANFLGKVEIGVKPATLRVHRLTEAALDEPIRAELGQDCEETTLAHMFALLKKQAKGQAGPLLTNGYANIFYIRDVSGNLWAVDARWHGGGWDVDAGSVTNPLRWHAGRRVFSRDS